MYIIAIIFFVLVCYEAEKERKEKYRLASENYDLKKELEFLKTGKKACSIGGGVYFLSDDEEKRYEKWHKFYYNNNKRSDIGCFLPDDVFMDLVIKGIMENKSNDEILKTIYKEEHK